MLGNWIGIFFLGAVIIGWGTWLVSYQGQPHFKFIASPNTGICYETMEQKTLFDVSISMSPVEDRYCD